MRLIRGLFKIWQYIFIKKIKEDNLPYLNLNLKL